MESREGEGDATEIVVRLADKLPIEVEGWLGRWMIRIGEWLEKWGTSD